MVRINQNKLDYIKNNYDNLSFIYYDSTISSLGLSINEVNKSNLLHSIHLNGGCRLGFILQNNQPAPVLIITESKLFTAD